MDRYYLQLKDKYVLCFDTESLNWIIGDRHLFKVCNKPNSKITDMFNEIFGSDDIND